MAGLLAQAHRVLVPGGFLVVTARSGSGFDVQVLWEYADVSPLEHFNLISVEGCRRHWPGPDSRSSSSARPDSSTFRWYSGCGSERGAVLPRFLEYLLSHRDALCHEKFQDFIQEQRLSSHMHLIARKSERHDAGEQMPTQNDSTTMDDGSRKTSSAAVLSGPATAAEPAKALRCADPRRDRRAWEGRRPPCRLRPFAILKWTSGPSATSTLSRAKVARRPLHDRLPRP